MTDNEDIWRELFEGGNAVLDRSRAVFKAIPSDPRCMFCNSPFSGLGKRLMPVIGRGQSREDPRLCNACIKHGQENPGGAYIDLAMLFADMRGSTSTAERIGDRAFTDLINRFFQTSSEVLIQSGALLGRLAGDEAIGYYVPGIAGPEYARAALDGAMELLEATGHTDDAGPWIPLGVGVHAGNGYMGLVGSPGESMELTALGDEVNVGARLADAAGAGEILASLQLCRLIGVDTDDLERRELTLKGKEAPMEVVVITPS
jgi:adenylate cyclase